MMKGTSVLFECGNDTLQGQAVRQQELVTDCAWPHFHMKVKLLYLCAKKSWLFCFKPISLFKLLFLIVVQNTCSTHCTGGREHRSLVSLHIRTLSTQSFVSKWTGMVREDDFRGDVSILNVCTEHLHLCRAGDSLLGQVSLEFLTFMQERSSG